MSTKNLARTVIEGGRRYYNSWERRHSHGEARAQERVVRDAARTGEPDELVWPEPKHVPKSFHDKLSPAEQWLLSKVGRPWDRVRSEIAARFDTRTLAGQHIVFDHLLPRRWDIDGTWRVSRARFFVDAQGLLRAESRRRSAPSKWIAPPSWLDLERARVFAGDRKVVVRGAHAYWLVPVPSVEVNAAPRYRQDRELRASERRDFDALSDVSRALVVLPLP